MPETAKRDRSVAKAIVLFTIAAASYAAILAPGLPSAGRWLACLTLGLAFAGLGMAVGHDAIHGRLCRMLLDVGVYLCRARVGVA